LDESAEGLFKAAEHSLRIEIQPLEKI